MAKKKKKPSKKASKRKSFLTSGFGLLGGLLDNLTTKPGGPHPKPLDLAQEIADLAWEVMDPDDRLALAQQALKISPDCADAYIILANMSPSREMARNFLEGAVAAGERALGAKEFAAAAGHFWLDPRTRPYMRARMGLAQCLWESGMRKEAVEHFDDMLRLNPSDNQGVRYLLLGALIDLDCDSEAQDLLQRYQDEASAEWAYTAALLAFRREGDTALSRSMLRAAADANRYVPDYLVGSKPMPPHPPVHIGMGGADEAVGYVAHFLINWRSSSGAIPWLRKTLKIALPQPPKLRKPMWTVFRQRFLRLPQIDGEVWQMDICRLPASAATLTESGRPPWSLVLWNRTEETLVAFEAGDKQPTIGVAWEILIEALLRPRSGEPHRPAAIQFRRKSFWKNWNRKLKDIHIASDVVEELDGLDQVLETLIPESPAVRRILDKPETPVSISIMELAALPQQPGETWQADVRLLPGWLEQAGELCRPWASLVANCEEHLVLTQNMTVEQPPEHWIWKNIVDAIHRPMMGDPHRPEVIEVATAAIQSQLQEPLDTIGVRCIVSSRLEQIDEIFRELGKFLSGGNASPPLVEVPGVRLEQVHGFYDAAYEFYRAAPWRLVPGDTTIKIECKKFQSHTWYAVVMGQSGLVLGLALYEDLAMLHRLFAGETSEEQMAQQATGLSVMYGEAFELPIADLEASERYEWPIAGPEAYPNPIYVNPGRSMRPPLAWELELLEGCLLAVPRFLAGNQEGLQITVPVALGELSMRLSLA